MTGGTVDGIGVYSVPTGVVAVSVFDGVDGITAAFIDVAVVTIETTVVKVPGAGLDDSVVGKTSTNIGTMAAEAVGCVGECENWFGEGTVVNTTAVVAGALGTAGVGRVVGTVVGDVAGVAWVGHGS